MVLRIESDVVRVHCAGDLLTDCFEVGLDEILEFFVRYEEVRKVQLKLSLAKLRSVSEQNFKSNTVSQSSPSIPTFL